MAAAHQPIQWTKQITPTQVLQLIRAERDTRKALAIFNSATAEYPNGYRHDHHTFSLIISRLASSNHFSSAQLLLRMASDLYPNPIPEDPFLSLLHAYARAHLPLDALRLFRRMPTEFRCEPTTKSYVTLLTALVDGDRLKMAHSVYKEMKEKGFHRCLAAYNVMIKAFCKNERTINDALKVFERMPERGLVPDSYTYGTLINGLCRFGRIEKAVELFKEMGVKGCEPSVITYSALIHGYCVCGRLDNAVRLFDEMGGKGVKPNVVTYSSLIDGMCKGGRCLEAMGMLDRMVRARCLPNMITYSSLVNGLCKEGKLWEALELMDRMRLHGCKPDAGLYAKLILGLFDDGKYQDAANFLDEMMLGGVKPNRLTWGIHIKMHNMVVQGLCVGNDPNRAFQVYLSMQTRCITTVPETCHFLVDCFCKKGDVHKAARIVNEMLAEGCNPDLITWNVLLDGYWDRRKVREASELVFAQLKNDI